MSVENDFLIFANDATNIETQTSYNADPSVIDGFSSGTASSASFNKVLRQGSTGMALLAAFIQQMLPNQSVLDTGSAGLSVLLGSLTSALDVLIHTQPLVSNNVTNSSGTILTAGQLVGFPMAFIQRSGPASIFTDTTDTAANLITQIGGSLIGSGFIVRIANTTTYTQTVSGGTGVTMIGTNTILGGAWRDFSCEVTDITTPTITFTSQGGGTN